jgi:PTH1 family peptidyl-tRNA hydrolase
VGHPGNRDEVADWVLRKPSAEQRELIESCVARSLDALDLLIDGPMERAMMKIHAKPKVAAATGVNGAAPAAPAK